MFTYEHLNTAFRILLPSDSSPPKPLIATHRAKYVRTAAKEGTSEHDTLSLGPGPFVAALEAATGVHAETVGKPGRTFFETVIGSFGFQTQVAHEGGRIVIIGDDVETDLGGAAVELGLWRVLGAHRWYFACNAILKGRDLQSRRGSTVLETNRGLGSFLPMKFAIASPLL